MVERARRFSACVGHSETPRRSPSLNGARSCMTKHERALESLARDGYISIARSGELVSLVGRALKDARPAKRIDDMNKIYESMRALI